jgi:ankyrin repeat protein
MYAAANNRNPEVVTTLVRAGANLDARNNIGMTPLMAAAGLNKNPEVVVTLLKAGSDAKVKDRAGATALTYAQGNEKLKGTDAYQQLQEASR